MGEAKAKNTLETPSFAITVPSVESQSRESLSEGGVSVWADTPYFQISETWPDQERQTVANDHGELTVVGQCFADEATLRKKLDEATMLQRPEILAELPGNYAAFLLEKDRVSVVGDLVGQTPIYYEHTNGKLTVGSRPSIAARGAPLTPDLQQIAVQLLIPGAEGVIFGEKSSFNNIHKLLGGQVLRVTPDSTRVETYETLAPDPQITLVEAAKQLRESLTAAVAHRFDLGIPVSSDFSGGMDSSSLAFLAAKQQGQKDFPVFFSRSAGRQEGDVQYVEQFLNHTSQLKLHEFIRDESTAAFDYKDFLQTPRPEDLGLAINISPNGWKFVNAYFNYVAEHGGAVHMTGDGGDEVVGVRSYYLMDLAQPQHLARFLREGIALARLHNLSPSSLLRASWRQGHSDPSKQLREVALGIDMADFSQLKTGGAWQPVRAALAWLTENARHDASAYLVEHAAQLNMPEGLGSADFVALNALRTASQNVNMLKFCASNSSGISLHAPFLDRDVVRAAFSVAATERGNPYEFKYILRQALQGIIPSEVLERRSKGAYDETLVSAMLQGRDVFRKILAESYLGDLGIIEPKQVLDALDRMDTVSMDSIWVLDRVLSIEGWLRALEAGQGVPHQNTTREHINLASAPSSPSQDSKSSVAYLHHTFSMPDYVHAVASESGSLVLLNRKTNLYHPLDRTRSDIIRALTATGTVDQAVEQLSQQYAAADPALLQQDTERCLQELLDLDVLQINSDEGATRILPSTSGAWRLIANEGMTARNKEKSGIHLRDRLATLGAFVVGELLLEHIAPQAKLTALRYVQEKWCNREASQQEAEDLLRAAHSIPSLGRIACAEAPYAAALAAALYRKRIEWHKGVSFAPMNFHAWIEAEGRPVRTELEGHVTGRFQSFFENT